jgi:hypothetical protein
MTEIAAIAAKDVVSVPTSSFNRPLEGRPLRKPLDATYERKEFLLNMTVSNNLFILNFNFIQGELNKKVDAMKARQLNNPVSDTKGDLLENI